MPNKKEIYKITKVKKKELERELKKLKEVDLVEVADRLEESRRDDSDEDDANLGIISVDKESIEKRIREIEDVLENHEMIEDKEYCEPGQIVLGSEIKVKDGDNVLSVKLVSSIEADPLKNHISDKSPLGRKLLKAKLGDTVSIKVRGNTISYKILEVC